MKALSRSFSKVRLKKDYYEQKGAQNRIQNRADTETVLRHKELSEQLIAEIQSEIETLQQSCLSK